MKYSHYNPLDAEMLIDEIRVKRTLTCQANASATRGHYKANMARSARSARPAKAVEGLHDTQTERSVKLRPPDVDVKLISLTSQKQQHQRFVRAVCVLAGRLRSCKCDSGVANWPDAQAEPVPQVANCKEASGQQKLVMMSLLVSACIIPINSP